mmetsp:Transcript_33337/g.84208  ORF Transcript_33337/g.84208 Transcript_33337/m.84208 type:complete len:244 (+) Transcript_33337:78-809(+)|eukprot:CAMPEP_0173422992 /NCGR_PEP_ID=MMETSP1357-20121228/3481_1 /TAXON_ID=77926 /ORGANISM="Hemiselmis rufescens, Strain PCC563" /LENGTH=243 /DNA_ID=CAMNT_0014386067 /DNA_START=60 /DNA_END=791 /DNA_ORIENTATION=+
MRVALLLGLLGVVTSSAAAGFESVSSGHGRIEVCAAGVRLSLRGGWGGGGGASAVKEPVTGINFPGNLQAGGKSLELLGCGERRKKIVGPVAVNVYAIGMYVDQGPASAAGKGVSGEAAAAKALSDGSFTKSLRLVMARSVNAEKIGDALAEQIEPRVKGTGAPVDEFKGFFKGLEKLENQQVVIFTQTGSTLAVSAPGNRSSQFNSAPLCKALFDIYLGDKPVSDNAKNAMVSGFLKLCGGK